MLFAPKNQNLIHIQFSLQFGQVETIAAGIIDEWPEFLRPRRKLFTLILCIALFLVGIPLITNVS